MKIKKLDALLHPIRMRIMQALLGDKRLNVSDLLKLLPDIPQATLYRHINILKNLEIIEVIKENRIRGAVEKIYRLNIDNAHIKPEDVMHMTKEDHFNFFFKYILNILSNFECYLSQEKFDFMADMVSYRQVEFNLSDKEFMELSKTVSESYMKAASNELTTDRKRRLIYTITMPRILNKQK
jgi:DNA-binding transcriptional ArsR family regulator